MNYKRLHEIVPEFATVKPPLESTLIYRRKKDIRQKFLAFLGTEERIYKLKTVQTLPDGHHALYALEVKP